MSVVVLSVDSPYRPPVGLNLHKVVFITRLSASLDVHIFGECFLLVFADHRLGGAVGLETPFRLEAHTDFIHRRTTVEVVVVQGYLVEYELGVAALSLLGVECIGFNDKQPVLVGSGNLYGFPCQLIMWAVSAPLGNHNGYAAVCHIVAVEYAYHRAVGVVGCATYIDYDDIAVVALPFGRVVGHEPNFESTVLPFLELDMFECFLPAIAVGKDIANEHRRTAAFAQALDILLRVEAVSRSLECLYSRRGSLRFPPPYIFDLEHCVAIPRYAFECSPL